jgi:hypothetical protein
MPHQIQAHGRTLAQRFAEDWTVVEQEPEILLGETPAGTSGGGVCNSFAADLWALGMTLYSVAAQGAREPWAMTTEAHLKQKLSRG